MAEDEYKKIFSENLRYYMDLKGKNQIDLMYDLDLSSSTVSNWCTGLKLPRMDKIQMLADYLGIRKSDLIEKRTDDTDSYYLNPETQEMAQFLFENPEYKVLFDASRKVKPEDLKKAVTALGLFSEEDD